jgi:hypothetical protein
MSVYQAGPGYELVSETLSGDLLRGAAAISTHLGISRRQAFAIDSQSPTISEAVKMWLETVTPNERERSTIQRTHRAHRLLSVREVRSKVPVLGSCTG